MTNPTRPRLHHIAIRRCLDSPAGEARRLQNPPCSCCRHGRSVSTASLQEKNKNGTFIVDEGCQGRELPHLINFHESFGLPVIEAMARGTPVMAMRRGSMPELIEHGETGFLVDTVEEAVAAIDAIDRIDRAVVRQAVVDRFGIARMADAYIALYERVLSGRFARAA